METKYEDFRKPLNFLVISLILLSAGCSEPEDDYEQPSEYVQGLLDLVRSADHPDCRRPGQGGPLGHCPEGCYPSKQAISVIVIEDQCRLRPSQLGGDIYCVPDSVPRYACIDMDQCYIHPEETIGYYGWMCGAQPQGWRDYPPEGYDGEDDEEQWEGPGCGSWGRTSVFPRCDVNLGFEE